MQCPVGPWTSGIGRSEEMSKPINIHCVTNDPKSSGLTQSSIIALNFKSAGWSCGSGLNSFMYSPVSGWVSGALAAFRGSYSSAWQLACGQQGQKGCLSSAG